MFSSEKHNYHVHCPTGVDSWCSYQLDIANKINLYVPGKGLPDEVIKHVKPISESLSDDHGKTQHNTTQHNTTQHNTTQHNTTQHNTTQHNATQQHNTKMKHIMHQFGN